MSILTTTKYLLRYPNLAQAADLAFLLQALAEDVDAAFSGYTQNVVASIPAAGTAGKFFFATDTKVLYYDDGSSWNAVNLIGAGSVTLAMLAANSVNSSKIVDGSIVAADIANDTITATQIAANAITSSELADNSVDSAAIINGAIVAADINAAAGITFGQLAHYPLRAPSDTDYRIEVGTVNLPSGSGVTASVVYATPFATAPKITLGFGSPSVYLLTKDNIGFTLAQVFGASTADHDWMAVGV